MPTPKRSYGLPRRLHYVEPQTFQYATGHRACRYVPVCHQGAGPRLHGTTNPAIVTCEDCLAVLAPVRPIPR